MEQPTPVILEETAEIRKQRSRLYFGVHEFPKQEIRVHFAYEVIQKGATPDEDKVLLYENDHSYRLAGVLFDQWESYDLATAIAEGHATIGDLLRAKIDETLAQPNIEEYIAAATAALEALTDPPPIL